MVTTICYSKRRFVTNTGSRATIYTAEKLLRLLVRRFFGGYKIIERGSMNAEEFKTIAIDDTITYTLSPDQRPRIPQREYKGVVNRIFPADQMVIVTLLDEGYEGLSEPVRMSQISSVAKP
jgi:hypothetical protein